MNLWTTLCSLYGYISMTTQQNKNKMCMVKIPETSAKLYEKKTEQNKQIGTYG